MFKGSLFAFVMLGFLAASPVSLACEDEKGGHHHTKADEKPLPTVASGERRIEVNVSGLHCQSCVENATKALRKLESDKTGPLKVVVSLTQNKAFIDVKEGKNVDLAQIRQALESARFKVSEAGAKN